MSFIPGRRPSSKRLFWSIPVLAMICSAQATADTVSIQLINPDRQTLIQVRLDRALIYDAKPDATPNGVLGPMPILISTFVNDGSRHVLTVSAPGTSVKAQLEWIPAPHPRSWAIIHYYSGQNTVEEPGFFTFSLQQQPFLRK